MYIVNFKRPTLGKLLGYLLWKKIFRKNGKFCAHLDQYFWGPSRGLNEYNEIKDYKISHIKPDKQYSILPTVINLVGDYKDKVIVDLGCGTGFFCIPFIHGAKKIFGIDNSRTQLDLAKKHQNIEYLCQDIFISPLPIGDIIIAPFVANYASSVYVLEYFFQSIYQSLSPDGKVVFVFDLPNKKELKKFGALKKILGPIRDEAKIQIILFNGEEKICDLNATYFTPATIEVMLKKVGFKNITWHKPIISKEGINVLGNSFWDGYVSDPELGYLTAKKTITL